MLRSARPTDEQIENALNSYSNMLFKLCFTLLGNNADAEDALSETFFKYIKKSPVFCDSEHEKAWLLKVARNVCRDMGRFRKSHSALNIDDLYDLCQDDETVGIMEEITALPEKYKTVIHLYYIEGYSGEEIAEILSITPAAVRKRLQYAREMLKFEIEKER